MQLQEVSHLVGRESHCPSSQILAEVAQGQTLASHSIHLVQLHLVHSHQGGVHELQAALHSLSNFGLRCSEEGNVCSVILGCSSNITILHAQL